MIVARHTKTVTSWLLNKMCRCMLYKEMLYKGKSMEVEN